jgi:IMP dehydrogenase
MSKDIISASSGISVEQAFVLMSERKKKILPIFSPTGEFEGIYTLADVIRTLSGDAHGFNLDASGSLCVGAAVGIGSDMSERLELLSQHRVDVIVIDTAHGNSKGVVEAIKFCKKNYPQLDVVAGNISEGEAAKRLVDAGADGLRVGQGPGSICTTRIVAGIGNPQVSAIYNCEKATRGSGVPICGDGGLETSGDIVIALAAGADCVMVGSLVAGTKESPGKIFFQDGKSVKQYRGMGSLEAMIENRASRERYGQENVTEEKLVAEGVKSWLNYKGEVENIIFQLLGGLRSGLGYIGAKDITALHERADFHRISPAGLKESHPHGLDRIETETRFITQ